MARKRKLFWNDKATRAASYTLENEQVVRRLSAVLTLVIVELRPYKRIMYCDTLAFDPPSSLVDVVNKYTSHIPRIRDFTESHLSVAHSPLATSGRGHLCDRRCRNYPLQTYSDICGVIVLISATLASFPDWPIPERESISTMPESIFLLP